MTHAGLIRVAIVEQHDMFIDCLSRVLQTRRYDCRRVAVPTDEGPADRVSPRLLALQPDVALINVDLGRACSGVRLIEEVARAQVPVVALSDGEDEALWGQYLAAGARIVMPKSASLASMITVIRKLGYGEQVLGHAERRRLLALGGLRIAEARVARERVERLTVQEGAVLRCLMAGHNVCEIAEMRGVSAATVRTQVKSVLAKLEVSSQLSAVALAHRGGWTPAQDVGPREPLPSKAEFVA